MSELFIRPTAQKDIKAITDYYSTISPNLTAVFLNGLETCLKNIQHFPKAHQKRFEDVRVAFIKHFSFGVYYKMYDKKNVVIAVLHTSQNPEIWKKR